MSVAAPFFYTSNIALARSGEISDFLVAPAAGVFYEPRITRTLYGYSVHLSRWFSLDGAGRVVVRDYSAGDRADVSEILSVSANYRLTPWWTMSAISSFAANRSNHSAFDYNVANVGGVISLSLKF